MSESKTVTRRFALAALGTGAAASLLIRPSRVVAQGPIRQSVCRWCYQRMPLEELCRGARRIGLESVELIGPEEYKIVKAHGLKCAVTWGTGPIEDCLNRTENHDRCERELRQNIEFAAAEKIPNVICFSGNRRGMSDEEGLENCAAGIKRVVGFAEKMGVTILIELLNSKVDHQDYMGDHMSWGVPLIRKVDSPRFKLLYDIYHMQIMEGDVIRSIRDNQEYIAHYHTAGVPGRHEIDDTQELYYPAIVRAILETGYEGYLGQEFIPTREPMFSLAQGFEICNV